MKPSQLELPFVPEIRRVSQADARSIVNEYHYSHNVPAGKNVHFGWFLDGELYAVASYGIGVNHGLAGWLAKITGLNVTNKNMYELKRLARKGAQGEGKVPLSKLLSLAHKMLYKEDGIRYIVSYSDPDFNPHGGIYKASGFVQVGETKSGYDLLNEKGFKTSRRNLLHWRKAHGNPSIKEACAVLGYQEVRTPPKKRWFMALEKREKELTRVRDFSMVKN